LLTVHINLNKRRRRRRRRNKTNVILSIGNTPILNENGCWNLSITPVKSEPVCVFVNRNYDENSSDSEHLQEQPLTIDEEITKPNNIILPP
jgi:hypothetical protein